jgi:hypothetical protein
MPNRLQRFEFLPTNVDEHRGREVELSATRI